MIVHHSNAGLRLDDAENFRAFKLVLSSADDDRPQGDGIRFVDDDNVLIDPELVPTLPGAPQTAEWRQGYEAMREAAARFGWIDAPSGAIKAHVERTAS